MVDFITVTHQENPEVFELVNLDAIDTVNVVEPAELAPLESGDDTVTDAHIGYCDLTLRSGRVMKIAETGEDFAALLKSPNGGADATKKLGDKRRERKDKMIADRVKARADHEAKTLEAKHKAERAQQEKEVVAAQAEADAAKEAEAAAAKDAKSKDSKSKAKTAA